MNFRSLRKNFWDYLRAGLRGHIGARIGRGVKLTGPGTYDLRKGSTISRGARAWVGEGATFTMMPGSKIGDRSIVNVETGLIVGENTEISWDVQILDTDFHWVRDETGVLRPHTRAIRFESNVLVGSRAMILKGVSVGKGSIIGASAVVRHSVAAGIVVSGNPAKPVGKVSEWGNSAERMPDA